MLLCEEKSVTCRAMDVVEMDIRNTPGNRAFRLDTCIVEIAMNVKVKANMAILLRSRDRNLI